MTFKKGDRVKIVDLTHYCTNESRCNYFSGKENCLNGTGVVVGIELKDLLVQHDKIERRCYFVERDLQHFTLRELL